MVLKPIPPPSSGEKGTGARVGRSMSHGGCARRSFRLAGRTVGVTSGQRQRALHMGRPWGLGFRRCLPQTLTLDRAQQLVAAVVGLLAEFFPVYSFLSTTFPWKGGSEGTLGATGNPVFPFCSASSSTRSDNPRVRD